MDCNLGGRIVDADVDADAEEPLSSRIVEQRFAFLPRFERREKSPRIVKLWPYLIRIMKSVRIGTKGITTIRDPC
jgi:hypothetical protein